MTEQRNQLADLFAACWKDEALKQRFMADPRAISSVNIRRPKSTETYAARRHRN